MNEITAARCRSEVVANAEPHYHQFPGEGWPADEFSHCSVQLAGGEVMTLKLAERGSRRSNGLYVLQARKRSETGRQTSLLSTHYRADYTALAALMLAQLV